ncbi:TldD/PmbA family protein [Deinococcus humi]|uniref:PmbA protein n=1 Tax=Deinococcus humi TaxID=662880 RepID=A0A7W8JW04_9DEIO|nr:TldD/PmbA family protein [Deinococcus humi]MBB5364266.1 PmbA protein [Deinococcus humi]GGO35366.1 Zn-dependent protease [Deinococcus humi]
MTRMELGSTEQLSIEAARTYLLERAGERGVALEVFAQRQSSTSVQAFGGEVSQFKLANRQGVGLRALVGGAWGYSFSENLSPAALDRALDSAVENAQLVHPERGAALVAWGEPPALDLYGEGLSGVSVEQKVGVALALESAAKEADPRVTTIPYGGYQDGDIHALIANTEGLERTDAQLYAMQYVYPLVSEDGQTKMSGDWQFTREFTELDPTRTALSAVEKATRLLGARPAPSGTFPAVFSGECLAEVLMLFSPIFSGRMVEEGKSPLAGRLGETIASPLVTLVDDATLPRGLSSRAFDAEGCPSAPLTLVDGGRLSAFMHNQDTAARAGTVSTGHASRHGYQGTVSVGPSNLMLLAGNTPAAGLTGGLTGVRVTGVSGGHAGANPITGDFSLEAEGFWFENGAEQHPLEVFTVAGNFLELLAGIEAVGDEIEWSNYSAGAPAVRVGALGIGGS